MKKERPLSGEVEVILPCGCSLLLHVERPVELGIEDEVILEEVTSCKEHENFWFSIGVSQVPEEFVRSVFISALAQADFDLEKLLDEEPWEVEDVVVEDLTKTISRQHRRGSPQRP